MNQGIYGLTQSDGRDPSRPYATPAQAKVASSAATIMSPAQTEIAIASYSILDMNSVAPNFSGQVANSNTLAGRLSFTYGSASGQGTIVYNSINQLLWSADATKYNGVTGNYVAYYINWTKRTRFRFRFFFSTLPSANSTFRALWGRTTTGTPGVAPLANRGIAMEVRASGALWLSTHNGSSRTDTNTNQTLQAGAVYEVMVESDGIGNAALYLDGTPVATSTGAPTTLASDNLYQMFIVEGTTTDSVATNVTISRYILLSIT